MTGRAISKPPMWEGATSASRGSAHATTRRYALWILRAVIGLVATVACYLSGEWLTNTLSLPIPGSVVGMVLLFIVLSILPVRFSSAWVAPAAEKLVGFIPFLLVPAAVGVVAQLVEIARDAPALVAAVVGGWIVTLLVSASAATFLLRRSDTES